MKQIFEESAQPASPPENGKDTKTASPAANTAPDQTGTTNKKHKSGGAGWSGCWPRPNNPG